MSLTPGVRVLLEGAETLIANLPDSTPLLAKNDHVVLEEVGSGVSTTYKVELVRYICEYETLDTPGLPDEYEVHGRVDLIVSIVP